MINRDGLTVSLDHLSFEDVIRDADVSRSAVYRRWPYKDLFFSDLVKELAKNATPTIADEEVALLRQILGEHLDWFDTRELRHSLVVELVRQLALLDFQTIYGSPGWRTYVALHATVASLAPGELRDQVQEALARSEQTRAPDRDVLGAAERTVRLSATTRARGQLRDHGHFAQCLHAGLVITALSTPDVASQRVEASPFGAASKKSGPWPPSASPAWHRRSWSPIPMSSGTTSGSPTSSRPCVPGSLFPRANRDPPGSHDDLARCWAGWCAGLSPGQCRQWRPRSLSPLFDDGPPPTIRSEGGSRSRNYALDKAPATTAAGRTHPEALHTGPGGNGSAMDALNGGHWQRSEPLVRLLDGRWTIAVLAQLVDGGRRYQELHDALDGISLQGLDRHAATLRT